MYVVCRCMHVPLCAVEHLCVCIHVCLGMHVHSGLMLEVFLCHSPPCS